MMKRFVEGFQNSKTKNLIVKSYLLNTNKNLQTPKRLEVLSFFRFCRKQQATDRFLNFL